MEYISLNNGVCMPKMVLGSFNISEQEIINNMVSTALAERVSGFDTSPSYGSEKILGKALQNARINRKEVFISDKIDVWQMYEGKGKIRKYVEKSLKDLKTDYLDLLLIHWPFRRYLLETWKSFEFLYEQKLVRSIGLCNVNSRVYSEFMQSEINIEPHVIQVEISPLRTINQDLELFFKTDVVVEAYSPLCRMVPQVKDNAILQMLAKKYDKSIPQIILRWHLERGIIPVFTSSRPDRIRENVEVFNFKLEQSDINLITSLNADYKIFPESYGCPGY